jgi:hypothetical protein
MEQKLHFAIAYGSQIGWHIFLFASVFHYFDLVVSLSSNTNGRNPAQNFAVRQAGRRTDEIPTIRLEVGVARRFKVRFQGFSSLWLRQ